MILKVLLSTVCTGKNQIFRAQLCAYLFQRCQWHNFFFALHDKLLSYGQLELIVVIINAFLFIQIYLFKQLVAKRGP